MQITQLPGASRTDGERARWRQAISLTAAMAGIALLATACGTSSTPPIPSRQSPIAAAFRYSECMRAHGMPDFPDPKVTNLGGSHHGVVIAIRPSAGSAPQFQTAQKACRGILPEPSRAEQAQQAHAKAQHLLAFARCIRGHGVTAFPDPTSQGQLTLEMLSAAGVDLHAPAVLAAARSCLGAAGGAVTAADLQRVSSGGR
jgi:hypothetical protein